MAKCVFGLHRRGRIACPPFSKRGQNMIRFRWFFGPVVEVASKVCPKCVKGVPQWTQMSVNGAQKEPKGWPRESKGAQRVLKGCPKVPKDAQRVLNGWPMEPKVCPKAQRCQNRCPNRDNTSYQVPTNDQKHNFSCLPCPLFVPLSFYFSVSLMLSVCQFVCLSPVFVLIYVCLCWPVYMSLSLSLSLPLCGFGLGGKT